jgi:hypothetical protein
VRGENGEAWRVENGELLQPDQFYPGNTVLTSTPISWGDYAFDWDMRPIAKSDFNGPVCWAQSGQAAAGFDWDCSVDMNGVPADTSYCGEFGRTYHFRIETVDGTASLYVDGVFIVSGPYDPAYSMGFIRVETNNTSAAFDNFALTNLGQTAVEQSSWGALKGMFR